MLTGRHVFGGIWTQEKLERVRKYLAAYTKIFAKNPKAQTLTTIYVDAFAGTGYRTDSRQKSDQSLWFQEFIETDVDEFLKGSARIALEVDPPFNQYLFIEQSSRYAKELSKLKAQFSNKSVDIVRTDANIYLKQWCAEVDWRRHRAVMLLDPYGMQVEWSLIETIACTQAVDLWILFPLGAAVSRLLTKIEPPPDEWAQALTRIFGTDEWRKVFYSKQKIQTLFGEEEVQVKDADFDKIGRFFVRRLKTVFADVAENPLPLRNSKNVPLYLLCFAASNPKGAQTAIKIAQDLLRR